MPKVKLIEGDSIECMRVMSARSPAGLFDVIFADPPYFLSGGGPSCRSGRRVSVNKGKWDKQPSFEEIHAFNLEWLTECRKLLKESGTLWVCGTNHNVFSLGIGLRQLGFRVLNDVIWEKPNPPPNLGCRTLTHSHETIIWASKSPRSRHNFNYREVREANGKKQLKTVWRFKAPGADEKAHGRHPTQKPLSLVKLCLQVSCPSGGVVLDPFLGSGTTCLAAKSLGFDSVGIEKSRSYLNLAKRRLGRARE